MASGRSTLIPLPVHFCLRPSCCEASAIRLFPACRPLWTERPSQPFLRTTICPCTWPPFTDAPIIWMMHAESPTTAAATIRMPGHPLATRSSLNPISLADSRFISSGWKLAKPSYWSGCQPPKAPGSRASYLLYRVPLTGGRSERVEIGIPLDEFRCPLSQSGACILRQTIEHREFIYYSLDPVTGKGPELGRTAWAPTILGDWNISPDGSAVAIAIHDRANPRIRIVPLHALAPETQEHEILVSGFEQLSDAVWIPDRQGFYCEAQTTIGVDLLYVDLQGRTTVLRESVSGIWGVPSLDGTRVAFVDRSVDSNVWIR